MQGYTSIQFLSGDRVTDNFNADITVAPGGQVQSSHQINSFEIMLAQTSLLHAFYNFQIPLISENDHTLRNNMVQQNFDAQRDNILYTFSHLPDFSGQPEAHFIFAHIPSPHYPYVFGPNGENVDVNAENYLLNTTQSGSRAYTDQMQYINRLTLQSIDRILSQSKEPPIIILQSDHGHDLLFNWETPDKAGIDLRSANLTAIYYPDRAYNALYPSISPVNIFRCVFNHIFRSNFPLLADTTFYHSPPDIKPVSSQVLFYNACIDFNLCSSRMANINSNQ